MTATQHPESETGPERIYAWTDRPIPTRGKWSAHPAGPGAAYVRADLHEAALASLRQSLQIAQSAQREAEREREDARAALRNIAEGNLGDGPGQASYDRIRAVAIAALSPREEPAAREQEAEHG